ncbi:hypothetical protein LAC81_26890 [Ensifer adhaerens]|uniref:hypothetical protein n=1 Tax=Ensifer adhaerens TaxID=106592 RepID=UPI001CBD1B3E|nr:hypothetical protein [Ensifer adhaerens]MBZ7924357.1 hypothetical protein [Ensifer adhaerens]UAX96394.1 hypothetical protein LAC78_21595 [Ensifer adhaerens]UAY04263.1 hypothetical protein LAC80_23365 [Ensifer adhaerens]UAY12249.1 hypothetical protein LAC81_26890 [Ensifer adhaerens]
MIEKIGHIKNPLTVIAAFAGFAEVSGTVILPFLEKDIQYTYVWFLMLFPTALVGIFFTTLALNHVVLYAPSDYSDPNSFERLFEQSKPSVRLEKINIEATESEATTEQSLEDAAAQDGPTFVGADEPGKPLLASSPALLAEELLIARYSKDRGISLARGVSPAKLPNIGFDGVAITSDSVVIVETKFYRKSGPSLATAKREMGKVAAFVSSLANQSRSVTMVWAIALDYPVNDPRVHQIKRTLKRASLEFPFKVEVVFYEFNELVGSATRMDG